VQPITHTLKTTLDGEKSKKEKGKRGELRSEKKEEISSTVTTTITTRHAPGRRVTDTSRHTHRLPRKYGISNEDREPVEYFTSHSLSMPEECSTSAAKGMFKKVRPARPQPF
jgi:hypothetical protein